jgi:hypothetical protein
MTIVLRNRATDYDRTRSMIQKLIVYVIGTGLVTVVVALMALVLVRYP